MEDEREFDLSAFPTRLGYSEDLRWVPRYHDVLLVVEYLPALVMLLAPNDNDVNEFRRIYPDRIPMQTQILIKCLCVLQKIETGELQWPDNVKLRCRETCLIQREMYVAELQLVADNMDGDLQQQRCALSLKRWKETVFSDMNPQRNKK